MPAARCNKHIVKSDYGGRIHRLSGFFYGAPMFTFFIFLKESLFVNSAGNEKETIMLYQPYSQCC